MMNPEQPTPPTPRPKAIVCLSGGLDSAVTAAMAAQEFETYAVHFSYGQRTELKELSSAQAVVDALGLQRLLPLRINIFRLIGGSALTDVALDIPEAEPNPDATGALIPATYVPFRNTHFLAAAISWAEVIGAKTVFIGAVEQDSSGYPDCRPAYYEAFQQLIRTGTRDADIEIRTPLIHLRKHAIVRLGLELGAPFHVTWSCYAGEHIACGVCESCVLRLRAFAEAGVDDPLPYATNPLPS
jgi:7-cyano-7-deazaguanine synthase